MPPTPPQPVALSDYLVRCEANPLGFAAPVPLDHRCEPCAGGLPACPCRLRLEFTGPGDPGRTMCPAPSGSQFYGGAGARREARAGRQGRGVGVQVSYGSLRVD